MWGTQKGREDRSSMCAGSLLALECQFKVDVLSGLVAALSVLTETSDTYIARARLMIHSTLVCPRSPALGLEGSQLCHKLEDIMQVI